MFYWLIYNLFDIGYIWFEVEDFRIEVDLYCIYDKVWISFYFGIFYFELDVFGIGWIVN